MKKFLPLFLVILCMAACTKHEGTTIYGTAVNFATSDTLYAYIVDKDSLDTINLEKSDKFSITVPADSGMTQAEVLLFWSGANQKHGAVAVVQQLGHDVKVKLEIQGDTLLTTFDGDLAARVTYENLTYQYTSQRMDFMPEELAKNATYKDLQKYMDERYNLMLTALEKTEDPEFIAKEKGLLEQQRMSNDFAYAIECEKEGRHMEEDQDFLSMTKKINLNDTAMKNSIILYTQWYCAAHPDEFLPLTGYAAEMKMICQKSHNQDVRNMIASNALQGEMFLFMYGMSPSDPSLKDFYEQYLATYTDTAYVSFCKEQLEAIQQQAPGRAAISFPIYDEKGNKVDFASLVGHGKVTYFDFWATWCGPCCKEIPYLAKLVEAYKGNDKIQFISISIDEDEQAWKKKLEADKPAWAQYIIRDVQNNAGIKGYSINSIPRFILFDKDGSLNNTSAPRPSDAETKALINSVLK